MDPAALLTLLQGGGGEKGYAGLPGSPWRQYPAEHNVGNLYSAEAPLADFYRELDLTNSFNAGIGKMSKFKFYGCGCGATGHSESRGFHDKGRHIAPAFVIFQPSTDIWIFSVS
ncbi:MULTISPECIES: hypothetical protein [Alphaproteobacteria]|uniref:D-lactate dehydrogenase membrane binding C-terminal domain-containing protein n=2 Tax=Alphaproteobacteria TaxID=28211 RepID=A0A512HNA8_9HYPH|nr:hypothetical protein [Sphingomonas psychrolutea]GEO86945.1 hypothetical protein RNA01_38770 [Ciceribacter naphthalenivorans]GLR23287.1 hypothetical protein GCM10007920_30760 [Ciceribacter naphthalenivorans]GLT06143.1 hypothetical protein GCM10007926_30760 [Sphingomonas psychrolutea]